MAHDMHFLSETREIPLSLDNFAGVEDRASILFPSNAIFAWSQNTRSFIDGILLFSPSRTSILYHLYSYSLYFSETIGYSLRVAVPPHSPSLGRMHLRNIGSNLEKSSGEIHGH